MVQVAIYVEMFLKKNCRVKRLKCVVIILRRPLGNIR
jgi:hypothetical protein